MNASTLVQKRWNYCTFLRDDGLPYGDYVDQPTFLLFLKMADEKTNTSNGTTATRSKRWARPR